MKIQSINQRVQKYLARQLKRVAYKWENINDPRKAQGKRWEVGELLNALLLGFVSGCSSLRAVEWLSQDMGVFGRKYLSRRIPDTTIWDLIGKLSPEELRLQLVTQVKEAWRAKELNPVGLPCGVVSIDGKGLGALEHDAEGTAQKTHNGQGYEYYLSRSLRAVLTSAEGRPCIDQMPIGPKTNEMGSFEKFLNQIFESYGANNNLFEIITTDAGMTSKSNAGYIHDRGKAYVMALKGPQTELLLEAERLLGKLRKPEAETAWERHHGKSVQRRLFRTTEIAGYHDWSHLRQAWRVEQITRSDDGKITSENRYFLTNLTQGRLSATQCLLLIRGHWRIENDCFGTLDLQWKEDSVPWCSKGIAVEVLSWLRLMAYNLLQLARRKSLRKILSDGTREAILPWQRIFELVKQAWILPVCE